MTKYFSNKKLKNITKILKLKIEQYYQKHINKNIFQRPELEYKLFKSSQNGEVLYSLINGTGKSV